MALIAVATADKIEVVASHVQFSGVAGEAISAGAPVRLDTTTGKLMNAQGDTAPHARILGIALKTAAANQALTVLRRGVLDGYTFSQAYDAAIYLSDTSGRLGDAAGTVSTVVGRVIPAHAVSLGTSPDKLLSVDL